MATPLKEYYNKDFVRRLAAALRKKDTSFDSAGFEKFVFDKSWKDRELKQRVRHISQSLHKFLPYLYKKQVDLLRAVAAEFKGLEAFVFPDFIEVYGLDDLQTSVKAMEEFTTYSTSEFAVRPFIIRYEKPMMKQMTAWAKSKNEHHRRLASEGCRPRLPWAMALPGFKKNPAPVLPVLELLKNDESEYVRRSVANNLNDIAKDHPQLALETGKKWLGKSPETDRLVKHALRTLLKKGNREALALFGHGNHDHAEIHDLKLDSTGIRIGENLGFSFSVSHSEKKVSKLRLEYAVYFMKANGKQSKKIFKISENSFEGGKKFTYKRTHRFRDFTTRVHYPGEHVIAVVVNGEEKARKKFLLKK
ncbi:MAG: DNA-3-methylpurine glycosylase [Bacteroidetes bacterium]|nr:MAG: DNA-3-methylpurine glycosylase [Bacteroidota bacterium]